ncbi:hypothetical protein ACI2LC_01120 [Nonomuraea wenchangensis]|uniref:hypothetical protein n=1 Tax=Nonomuraea wenchangensis TaxID=568860 RepID=UPI00384F36AA
MPSGCSTDPKHTTPRLPITGSPAYGLSSAYARAAVPASSSRWAVSATKYIETSQELERGSSARSRPRTRARCPAASR